MASKRARPAELVPGTLRVIAARMNYLPAARRESWECSAIPSARSCRATRLGRDYHKVLRAAPAAARRSHRSGSRPLQLSRVHRQRAGDGSGARRRKPAWAGAASTRCCLTRDAGSYFFLGEIYTDLPLPVDAPAANHCGTCGMHRHLPDARDRRALSARRAALHFVSDHRASRQHSRASCGRSSATASMAATIASSCAPGTSLRRPAAKPISPCATGSITPRWSSSSRGAKTNFDARLLGSAIHRIGYERWLRNIAVGWATRCATARRRGRARRIVDALRARSDDPSALVREHVAWALQQATG